MTDLIARVFGVEDFVAGSAAGSAAPVRFGFAHALPGWAWVLGVIFAALLAGWSYWKLSGSRPGRTALATLRTLTLLAVLALAAGPQLVRQPERTEKDWVVVLADRSKSMSIADVPGPGPGAPRATREDQLHAAFQAAAPAIASLAAERQVLLLGFDAGAYPLPAGVVSAPASLPAPAGVRTNLGLALDQALQQVAARPVSGVVILSDGRSSDQVTRSVLHKLEAEKIPVFAVPLGSAEPVADFRLAKVTSPSMAFIDDLVPVTVEVGRSGATRGGAATVRLIDTGTGLELDRQRVPESDDPARTVILTARGEEAGKHSWVVRIEPDAPDLSAENNAAEVPIELVDRALRVVYFDGYPRWEQRYLRSLLVRESSIRSAILLLAADKQFLQEGTQPLAALPASPGDWASIDVVILGDVRAELFSDEQLAQLRDFVALRGGGLIWLGGPGATPGSYRNRPIADLLPFTLDSAEAPRSFGTPESGVPAWNEPIVVAPAPAAKALGLLAMGETAAAGWPAELSDAARGWPNMRWAQRLAREQLKPSTEVLATASPASGEAGRDPTPLVMTMRFGAGRVVYVATDEVWRWRYGRGETLFERFWLPLVRFAARESLARTGKPAVLEVTPELARVDQPVRVVVRLVDQALIDARSPRDGLAVRVVRAPSAHGPAGGSAPIELTLQRDRAGTYSGTFLPPEPGEYLVEANDPLLSGLGLRATIDAAAPDDEMRTPQADHAALAALAEQTGGRMVPPKEIAQIANLLPNRRLRLLGTPEIRTLWDTPVMLGLLMVLLTAEWVGRKVLRLA